MAGTDNLAAFLLARIAEDEAVARAAIEPEPDTHVLWDGSTETIVDRGEWTTGRHQSDECVVSGAFMTIHDEGGHTPEHARHIARHDPARVLAECEAKRRIVEDYEALERDYQQARTESLWARRFQVTVSIAHLAAVYTDHADYDEAWRP